MLASAVPPLVLLFKQNPSASLRNRAVGRLLESIHSTWHQLAEHLPSLEIVAEEATGTAAGEAALLCSKLYYHLEGLEDAMRWAVRAGPTFVSLLATPVSDVDEGDAEYIRAISSLCVSRYVREAIIANEQTGSTLQSTLSLGSFGNTPAAELLLSHACAVEGFGLGVQSASAETQAMALAQMPDTDETTPHLEEVVALLVEWGLSDAKQLAADDFQGSNQRRELCSQSLKRLLSIGIDCRRFDWVKDTLEAVPPLQTDLLRHILRFSQLLTNSKALRVRLLEQAHSFITTEPYKCFQEPATLESVKQESARLAPFLDIMEVLVHLERWEDLANLLHHLLHNEGPGGVLVAHQIAYDLVEIDRVAALTCLLEHPLLQVTTEGSHDAKGRSLGRELPDVDGVPLEALRAILNRTTPRKLALELLSRRNATDLNLVEHLRFGTESKDSISHNALVVGHAFMQAYTTCDTFLRNNAEWSRRSTCWAKFMATSCLGLIHKGQSSHAFFVLSTFLPAEGQSNGGPYAEGGALFALGLIHASLPTPRVSEFLLSQLNQPSNGRSDPLIHGAALGLGSVFLCACDEAVSRDLMQVLFTDNVNTSEAAAHAIGMIYMGSADARILSELEAYCKDTRHERLIRACVVAMALVLFRQEQKADKYFSSLAEKSEQFLRYGAMFIYGMAYCGTSSNVAVRALLKLSVADSSNDVKRAAIISVGFVLCDDPKHAMKVLRPLSDSHNALIRNAAALAAGICACGSADIDAVSLLQPLTQDKDDVVRQAAFMSLGLVLMNSPETPKVASVMATMRQVSCNKVDDPLARLGAILGLSFYNCGGRNLIVSMSTQTGHMKRGAVAGMLLYSQMWFWFPLVQFVGLAFTPAVSFGVTSDGQAPADYLVKLNAPASTFALPKPLEVDVHKTARHAKKAVLATTMKRRHVQSDLAAAAQKEAEIEKEAEKEVEKEEVPEAPTSVFKNGARILPMHMHLVERMDVVEAPTDDSDEALAHLVPGDTVRFYPVAPNRLTGMQVLWDLRPEEDVVDMLVKPAETEEEGKDEGEPVPPPEPFTWDGTLSA
ncbi:MAG: hypothetical protein KVP17_004255 [Porospora cf. gigantea B]|uniref:uncharacterized protein n=2 Tax=Porospora cf. gigantea B TaxID=2853592 RepID=UPI003571CADC|nr:MAG: hypothetical protein KVP17_004255 [Porospora cf. gigantea B]